MRLNYLKLIQKLFEVNLYGGVKLGLSNCLRLDEMLDFPSRALKTIHVAGSNGKGSVTKKIAAALESAGYSVGIYTSPHISCFRERICINGQMISEESVESILSQLFHLAAQENLTPTFFEFTTLLALHYFALNNVDFAVLEVGLGGRLDATNIVTPMLSVITSISLEHTEILGNTIEEIAFEKAGIIKSGIPVVLGPRTPQVFLQNIAKNLCSPCIMVSGDFVEYEKENQVIARTALEALNISTIAINVGLDAHLPCRLEILTKAQLKKYDSQALPERVVLDVAHNADGLNHLFKALRSKFPAEQFRIVFGLSKTKDIAACLSIITQHATHFHLVEAPNGRGVPAKELRDALIAIGIPQDAIELTTSIEQSVQIAIKSAYEQKQTLIICGTFFIMGEVRKALGYEEPQDFVDMNERQKE
jgi:dihydrofolate synthase/folylpolyglutamate synthase